MMPTANGQKQTMSARWEQAAEQAARHTKASRDIVFSKAPSRVNEIYEPLRQVVKPEPPKHLGKRGAEVWHGVIDTVRAGHLTPSVATQLEAYCVTYLRWTRVRTIIDGEGIVIEVENDRGDIVWRTHPLYELNEKLTRMMMHQYRLVISALTAARQDDTFVTKLEAVDADLSSASARGHLIGGNLSDRAFEDRNGPRTDSGLRMDRAA